MLLNVYYKSFSKKINGNNNLFFHLYFFNTGFTKNTKKVLDHDKMDKLQQKFSFILFIKNLTRHISSK